MPTEPAITFKPLAPPPDQHLLLRVCSGCAAVVPADGEERHFHWHLWLARQVNIKQHQS